MTHPRFKEAYDFLCSLDPSAHQTAKFMTSDVERLATIFENYATQHCTHPAAHAAPAVEVDPQRFILAAKQFFDESFPGKVMPGDLRLLAQYFERFAIEIPRAPKDEVSAWREIELSHPPMWERVYQPVGSLPSFKMPLNAVGNIVMWPAGACWMLVLNGRIIRQSELHEGPEPLSDCQRACDDFRDRVVAMWNP